MLSQQRKNTFYVLTLVALAGTLLLNAHPAFAQVSVSSSGSVSLSSGGGALFSSGTNFLSALQTVLTSSWARLTAIIGVIFLGFAWMFGRISMHLALSVIGGIILVFGAPAIVDGISGSL